MAGLASLASLVWLFGFGHGTLDPVGRPLGTDFSQVYAAGQMVLDGHSADVWNWPKHFAVQQQLHHSTTVDLYGWHYPPPFLLIANLLATMPYLVALAVWQAATLAPFTAMLWRYSGRREAILLTLAAPVTLDVDFDPAASGFYDGSLFPWKGNAVVGGLVRRDRAVARRRRGAR